MVLLRVPADVLDCYIEENMLSIDEPIGFG